MESVDGVVGFGVVWTKAAASYKAEASHAVNTKKKLHRIFRHMHGVLNEVYLQNFLHELIMD